MKLENNMYIDFLTKNSKKLKNTMNLNTINSDEIVFIDFDMYTSNKNIDEIVFICNVKKLPDYARVKFEACADKKKILALKHHGLCLVSELPA
jgi:hypothetical protein